MTHGDALFQCGALHAYARYRARAAGLYWNSASPRHLGEDDDITGQNLSSVLATEEREQVKDQMTYE